MELNTIYGACMLTQDMLQAGYLNIVHTFSTYTAASEDY